MAALPFRAARSARRSDVQLQLVDARIDHGGNHMRGRIVGRGGAGDDFVGNAAGREDQSRIAGAGARRVEQVAVAGAARLVADVE